MIKSMTGFGNAGVTLPGKKLRIEIRSLNSKQLDLNLKIPFWLSEKEQEIRAQVSQLERGKVNVMIILERDPSAPDCLLDAALVSAYYNEIKALAVSIGDPVTEILPLVLQLPDITRTSEDPIGADQWPLVSAAIVKAIEETDRFRTAEGKQLANDLSLHIRNIIGLSARIEAFETARIERIRGRIRQELLSSFQENDYDKGRFEQELIFYLERLDITEEKVRLKSHCEFFLQTMKEGGAAGRKLGFITQEIGREINTLGSKANDLDIQKLVVEMKDELEKIKEQLLNIL